MRKSLHELSFWVPKGAKLTSVRQTIEVDIPIFKGYPLNNVAAHKKDAHRCKIFYIPNHSTVLAGLQKQFKKNKDIL